MGGAAIFLKKENFKKVGGFDEEIFLYHEDDDLSLRLKNEVGSLMYCPQAKIFHRRKLIFKKSFNSEAKRFSYGQIKSICNEKISD